MNTGNIYGVCIGAIATNMSRRLQGTSSSLGNEQAKRAQLIWDELKRKREKRKLEQLKKKNSKFS